MNIRQRRELKEFASRRLENVAALGKILLIFAGAALGLSAGVTVVNYVLGLQMDSLGGLGNMGKKSVLSTIQTLLPLASNVVTMCLELGLMAAMLRIARGQYVSEQTLRLGFDRFWVLLRCTILRGLIYAGAIIAGVYLGVLVYMATPLSDGVTRLLMPYLSDSSLLSGSLSIPDSVYLEFSRAVWPAYLLCGVFIALFLLPKVYSYRMADYVLIDKPGIGAMAALRESKRMMRGNRGALLKLDLSLWVYYLALLLAQLLCYGDLLLGSFGVALPGNGDLWYFVFFALYLGALFAVYYFLRPKTEVVYALAYDSLKPQEPKTEGVVLGNIFQM